VCELFIVTVCGNLEAATRLVKGITITKRLHESLASFEIIIAGLFPAYSCPWPPGDQHMYTHFVYNMSMNVRYGSQLEKLRNLLKEQRGIIRSSDLDKLNIPRRCLAALVKKGEIEKVSRGFYVAISIIADEMYIFQRQYQETIFTHETALYFHDLTDRNPLKYSVTVPAGYHSVKLKEGGHKIFYVNQKLFDVGQIIVKSDHGNEIRTTNLERTICDILRSRNQIEAAIINEAIKRYVRHKARDLNLLHAYARQFRVQNIVRSRIEAVL
jgi:predicted transcriptional regulator of viral defense system